MNTTCYVTVKLILNKNCISIAHLQQLLFTKVLSSIINTTKAIT